MTDSQGFGKERRRYPRIFLQTAEGFEALVGAKVVWSSGRKTDVLDLSYTGAALVQDSSTQFEKDQACSLMFQLSGQLPVHVESKVIRADGRRAAVQFDQLDSKARLAFETFLSDNLLGLHLRAVHPSYFKQGQDFDIWFHGPKDTNLFIWKRTEVIEKAVVEIDNRILIWNKGQLTQGKSRTDLSSAIEDYYSPVLYETMRAGPNVDQHVLARAIKLLTQIQESSDSIKQLLLKLKEKVKT